MNKKKLIHQLKIGGLLVIPLILVLLPAGFFDEGQSVCLSVLLLDIECYGCGMTRAVMHLMHFDFQAAWSFNKLSFIVFPLLVFLWGQFLSKEYHAIRRIRSLPESE
jgi:hypothetical protein